MPSQFVLDCVCVERAKLHYYSTIEWHWLKGSHCKCHDTGYQTQEKLVGAHNRSIINYLTSEVDNRKYTALILYTSSTS